MSDIKMLERAAAQAAEVSAAITTGKPEVDAAIDRLLDLPIDVKPTDAADRIADLLEAIGAPEALDMARRMREARCDGDRVLALFDELEKLNNDREAACTLAGQST